MKRISVLLFCCIMAFYANGQVDTIVFKAHSTSVQCTNGDCKYWVDGKQVVQSEYQTALAEQEAITKCKPCWLKGYLDKSGKLTYEGYFYTDCCVGAYIERYDNGAIKVKGQYKTPKDVNAPNLYNDGYCRREGVWTYYKQDGSVIKTDTYKDGDLVK